MESARIPVSAIQDLFPNKRIYEVQAFRMFYSGWECDEYGFTVRFFHKKEGTEDTYVVEKNGAVVLTSHGKAYVATKEQLEAYKLNISKAVDDIEFAMIMAGMDDEE
jgi:hypothetical protein